MTSFKLSSFLNLIIAIFFIFVGIASILFHWVTPLRHYLINFFSENSLGTLLFGIGFVVIGLSIFIRTLQTARHHHYHIQCGPANVTINEELVQQYLNTYWSELFPEQSISNKIKLQNNKIYVSADLPFLSLPAQKDTIQKIERELGQLFDKILGYDQEFYLSVSFKPES